MRQSLAVFVAGTAVGASPHYSCCSRRWGRALSPSTEPAIGLLCSIPALLTEARRRSALDEVRLRGVHEGGIMIALKTVAC